MRNLIRFAVSAFVVVLTSAAVAGVFSPRMVHSGVGQGQYPDAYLEQIAKSGIDSVIVNITDPLTGAYAGGTEDLDSLIRRAAAKGIGVYAYADFPVLSEKFHPAEPGAREWYDRIYGGLVKNHPGLKGLIFVGESVAFPYRDHRPTHHWWRPCKGGASSIGFNPDPDWAEWLRLVKSVTRQYNPDVDLVFWTYNWFRKPEKDRLALLELLPTDVSLLVTFDMGDNKARKCGIDMTVDDYSITVPGPGSTFASEAPVAKRRGIRLYSMTNTGGRTWDFGLLPYEPVPWRWKARFEAIRAAREEWGLCGLMESHHYGFQPNFIFDLGTRIFADDYRPEDFGKILRELAVRECGEGCADAVMAAWKDWSDAFEWQSSHWNDQYAVFRNGPVFPFCLPGAEIPDPLHPVYEYHDGVKHGIGWKYTIRTFEFQKDRLDGEEELATRELALLDRGVARLKGLEGAKKQWALGSFMAATIRTSRNAKRYYKAGLMKDSKKMMEILDDEERNVRGCFDWIDVDPQIGWEPTMGRVVARDTLDWKLRQLEFARRDAAAVGKPDDRVRFVVIDPGHFHAALVFKNPYGNDVSTDVRVYAPKGAELDAYLALLKSFNGRGENPTKWNVIVTAGDDYLERAVAENRGDARVVTVLAGRNDLKAKYARAAVEAGWNVLADKPLAITPATAAELREAIALARKKNLAFADIMTDRHEILNLLQSALAHDAGLFGEQEKGTPENPGVVRESVHHFFKLVNGSPLRRPAWYYDTDRQGAAIVDVTTHMADDIQWTVFPGTEFGRSDAEVLSARRWPTPVTLADYGASTGRTDWPDFLRRKLDGNGVLPCDANGEFTYRLKDVVAKIKVEWKFRAPPGGGDTEYAVMRGTKAEVGIRQTAADGFRPVLFVKGATDRPADETRCALEAALRRLSDRWPGLSVAADGDGWKVDVPAKYSITHEAQFGAVAKSFLGWVRSGQPLAEYANLEIKYGTLIEAYEKSVAE